MKISQQGVGIAQEGGRRVGALQQEFQLVCDGRNRCCANFAGGAQVFVPAGAFIEFIHGSQGGTEARIVIGEADRARTGERLPGRCCWRRSTAWQLREHFHDGETRRQFHDCAELPGAHAAQGILQFGAQLRGVKHAQKTSVVCAGVLGLVLGQRPEIITALKPGQYIARFGFRGCDDDAQRHRLRGRLLGQQSERQKNQDCVRSFKHAASPRILPPGDISCSALRDQSLPQIRRGPRR